ncbi:hypothetical protein VB796_19200 [Arcicella sp. LKC2W]|uniref:hypothetical protein n=1 Tax=Arcicella sp. LKC2W TaxID=2984198 RepID=UPI002B1F5690|nr:hypothetical protein [Arcicella sp. LKC2W]MEA5461199.1 hypothetical protein [Arcicella sp. LKC2W]
MIDYQDHVYVSPILSFLERIGIPVQITTLTSEMSLPGILINNGSLQIDLAQLKFPGDLLHEAGRIALAPSAVRSSLSHPIESQLDFDVPTNSMMTIGWSYAAAIEANIPLEVLFHPEGYKGQNDSILFGFQSGQYIGLPMLQWLGMAFDAQNAAQHGVQPFPSIQKWFRP